MTNYYRILGVKDFASTEQVKIAYRKLSKKFHPDVNDNDPFFEDRFKEIQIAYEVLSNNRKRAMHDDELRRFTAHHKQSDPPRQSTSAQYQQTSIYRKSKKRSSAPQLILSKTTVRFIYVFCLVFAGIMYFLIQEEKAEKESMAKQWQYFSLGATQAVVAKIQGKPTYRTWSNSFEIWHYDSSFVVFKGDSLIEIYNRDSNLKLMPKAVQ